MLDQNSMLNQLQNNICEVTFTKVDGTIRKMRCTLSPNYLPEEYRERGSLLTETERNNISVWDLEASGWRSFRVESVSTFTALNYNSAPQLLV